MSWVAPDHKRFKVPLRDVKANGATCYKKQDDENGKFWLGVSCQFLTGQLWFHWLDLVPDWPDLI